MPSKIVKLLIVLLVAAIISYVFYLNPLPAQVYLSPDSSITLPMALVLIATFFVGVLVTALFAFFIGLRVTFHTWRIEKKQKQVKEHHHMIAGARGELALKNFNSARGLFQKVIASDPNDVEARVLLAETYRRNGELKEALKVLEEARVEDKKNVELLLLAAEVNEQLGNDTAAFDNAAMVLKLSPKNTFALKRLVADCQRLNRYEEAVTYQEQLLRLVPREDYEQEQQTLAHLELKKAQKSLSGAPLAKALEEILKRHKDFTPARAVLAELRCDALELDAASKLWSKCFEESQDPLYLERIASMWIHADDPTRAVASVRNTLQQPGKKDVDVTAHVFFISLLLRLEMVDEARTEFEKLRSISLKDEELKTAYTVIKAKLLQKEGREDEALEEVFSRLYKDGLLLGKGAVGKRSITSGPPVLGWRQRVKNKLTGKEAPSPSLSTP